MIDSHTHTFYSKHAVGSVNAVVEAAISSGISVLTITDHAPFHVDHHNRLLEQEVDSYLRDIARARDEFGDRIQILAGLEVDWMHGCIESTAHLLKKCELDFVVGSVHYIPLGGNRINVWDLNRLDDSAVIANYLAAVRDLLESGIFDAIGHPDSLLRGISDQKFHEAFLPLLPLFNRHNVAYELNASGLRKSRLDPIRGTEEARQRSFPSAQLVPLLLAEGTRFTVGSDAHRPDEVGTGISQLLAEADAAGVRDVSYFVQRRRVDVPISEVLAIPRLSPAQPN